MVLMSSDPSPKESITLDEMTNGAIMIAHSD